MMQRQQRYARSGYRKADGYELDEVVDVSLLGLVTLGALPATDARVVATVESIREQLVLDSAIGGVARYPMIGISGRATFRRMFRKSLVHLDALAGGI